MSIAFDKAFEELEAFANFEKIGDLIDELDNITMSLIIMTKLEDRIHVEALRSSLPEIIDDLKKRYEDIKEYLYPEEA